MIVFQENEISSILAAVKRNDLKGVGQIRRFYLNGIPKYLSNYIAGDYEM